MNYFIYCVRSLGVSSGACALFTYVTYAILPVRLHEAVGAGVALGVVNVGAHLALGRQPPLQVCCGLAALLTCNVAGVMTHHPRELAQRRAFLETRDCVEARLVMQRENQQQERLPATPGAVSQNLHPALRERQVKEKLQNISLKLY